MNISMLIGKYLGLGISEHTLKNVLEKSTSKLIDEIKKKMPALELKWAKDNCPVLKGFALKELSYKKDENAFYLPLYRKDNKGQLVHAFDYKYSFDPEGADMKIPLDGRDENDPEKKYVFVKVGTAAGYEPETKEEAPAVIKQEVSPAVKAVAEIEKIQAAGKVRITNDNLPDHPEQVITADEAIYYAKSRQLWLGEDGKLHWVVGGISLPKTVKYKKGKEIERRNIIVKNPDTGDGARGIHIRPSWSIVNLALQVKGRLGIDVYVKRADNNKKPVILSADHAQAGVSNIHMLGADDGDTLTFILRNGSDKNLEMPGDMPGKILGLFEELLQDREELEYGIKKHSTKYEKKLEELITGAVGAKKDIAARPATVTPEDISSDPEKFWFFHEMANVLNVILNYTELLTVGGLDAEVPDNMRSIADRINASMDIKEQAGYYYETLSESFIQDLEKRVREKVPSGFKVRNGEDREEILKIIRAGARFIRLYCGYYIGKSDSKELRLNEALSIYPYVRQKIGTVTTFDFCPVDVTIYADEVALFTIAKILLLNANEATAEGEGSKITLKTRLDDGGKSVTVEIKDHGRGIPENDVALFDAGLNFVPKNYGEGFGLDTARDLVEKRLGGSFSIESRHISEHPDDHGVTVTIRLPVVRADPKARPAKAAQAKKTAPAKRKAVPQEEDDSVNFRVEDGMIMAAINALKGSLKEDAQSLLLADPEEAVLRASSLLSRLESFRKNSKDFSDRPRQISEAYDALHNEFLMFIEQAKALIEAEEAEGQIYRNMDDQEAEEEDDDGGDDAPIGSIPSVFELLCDNNVTSPEKALTCGEIAKGLKEERAAGTIQHDLDGLYHHLRLIQKADARNGEKEARYYVLPGEKEKRPFIIPMLRAKCGHGNVRLTSEELDEIYEKDIKTAGMQMARRPEENIRLTETEKKIPGYIWAALGVDYDKLEWRPDKNGFNVARLSIKGLNQNAVRRAFNVETTKELKGDILIVKYDNAPMSLSLIIDEYSAYTLPLLDYYSIDAKTKENLNMRLGGILLRNGVLFHDDANYSQPYAYATFSREGKFFDLGLPPAPGAEKIPVLPNVFQSNHASSRIAAGMASELSKPGMKVLIIGTGIGIDAAMAALRGAQVDAVDINEMAVENTKLTASIIGVKVNAFTSDLFDKIGKDNKYDLIVFNVPHVYRGKDMEDAKDYLKKPFSQITIDFGGSLLERLAAEISEHLSDHGQAVLVNSKSEEGFIRRTLEQKAAGLRVAIAGREAGMRVNDALKIASDFSQAYIVYKDLSASAQPRASLIQEVVLDSHNRITVPARLAGELSAPFYLLCKEYERCIGIYSAGEFEQKMRSRASGRILTDDESRDRLRSIGWHSALIDRLESGRRFIIPEDMLASLGAKDRRLVIVKRGERFEIRLPEERGAELSLEEKLKRDDEHPFLGGMDHNITPINIDAEYKGAKLDIKYLAELDPRSPIFRRWQERSGYPAFYTQQIGLEPTFTGVACKDGVLAKAFLSELVLSGLVWKQSIKESLLFVIEDNLAVAYAGEFALLNADLTFEAQALLNKVRSGPQKKAESAYYSLDSRDSHRKLVVRGRIMQKEAEELAEELVWYRHKALKKLGDVSIEFEKDQISIESKNADAKAAQEVLDFIKGFYTIVVFSDIHAGGKGLADNFGAEKEKKLCGIIDRASKNRSLIIINGDLLELWQEKYGNIRRSYRSLFKSLRSARRVIYVAGNHDEAVLQSAVDNHREEILKIAKENIVMDESLKASFGDLLKHPAVSGIVEQLAKQGHTFILSEGFTGDGIVLGENVFYINREILEIKEDLGEGEAAEILAQLIKDIQQSLSATIHNDLGKSGVKRVEIVKNYIDPFRGLYFEHGHVADPYNYQSLTGRFAAWSVGKLEKVGWKNAESDLLSLGYKLKDIFGKIFPKIITSGVKAYAERILAIGRVIKGEEADRGPEWTIFFGHTHHPVNINEGPLNKFSVSLHNIRYANTGTWSSSAEVKKRVSTIERAKTRVASGRKQADAQKPARKQIDTGKREDWFNIAADGTITMKNGVQDLERDNSGAKTAAEQPEKPDAAQISTTGNGKAAPRGSPAECLGAIIEYLQGDVNRDFSAQDLINKGLKKKDSGSDYALDTVKLELRLLKDVGALEVVKEAGPYRYMLKSDIRNLSPPKAMEILQAIKNIEDLKNPNIPPKFKYQVGLIVSGIIHDAAASFKVAPAAQGDAVILDAQRALQALADFRHDIKNTTNGTLIILRSINGELPDHIRKICKQLELINFIFDAVPAGNTKITRENAEDILSRCHYCVEKLSALDNEFNPDALSPESFGPATGYTEEGIGVMKSAYVKIKMMISSLKIVVNKLPKAPRTNKVNIRKIIEGASRKAIFPVTLIFSENLPEIEGDDIELDRAISNIINNAGEAMSEYDPKKQRLLTVSANLSDGGDGVEITISDTGAGIAKEDLPHIFDRYFTKGKKHGTGLGLAIAKEAVESRGGAIEVESELGKGTTFTIQLPIAAAKGAVAEGAAGQIPQEALDIEKRLLRGEDVDEDEIRAVFYPLAENALSPAGLKAFRRVNEFYQNISRSSNFREKILSDSGRMARNYISKIRFVSAVFGGGQFYADMYDPVARRFLALMTFVREKAGEFDFLRRDLPDYDFMHVFEAPRTTKISLKRNEDEAMRLLFKKLLEASPEWPSIREGLLRDFSLPAIKLTSSIAEREGLIEAFAGNGAIALCLANPVPREVWEKMPLFIVEGDFEYINCIRDLLIGQDGPVWSRETIDRDVPLEFQINFLLNQAYRKGPQDVGSILNTVSQEASGSMPGRPLHYASRGLREFSKRQWGNTFEAAVQRGLIAAQPDGRFAITGAGQARIEKVLAEREKLLAKGEIVCGEYYGTEGAAPVAGEGTSVQMSDGSPKRSGVEKEQETKNAGPRWRLDEKSSKEEAISAAADFTRELLDEAGILSVSPLAIEQPCKELAVNIITHGRGGEISLYRHELADGLEKIEVTGMDKGPGIGDLNGLLKKSREVLKQALRDPDKAPRDGYGFANIILYPHEVTIETGGVRYVRVGENTRDTLLISAGESDVKEGTKFTLAWYAKKEGAGLTIIPAAAMPPEIARDLERPMESTSDGPSTGSGPVLSSSKDGWSGIRDEGSESAAPQNGMSLNRTSAEASTTPSALRCVTWPLLLYASGIGLAVIVLGLAISYIYKACKPKRVPPAIQKLTPEEEAIISVATKTPGLRKRYPNSIEALRSLYLAPLRLQELVPTLKMIVEDDRLAISEELRMVAVVGLRYAKKLELVKEFVENEKLPAYLRKKAIEVIRNARSNARRPGESAQADEILKELVPTLMHIADKGYSSTLDKADIKRRTDRPGEIEELREAANLALSDARIAENKDSDHFLRTAKGDGPESVAPGPTAETAPAPNRSPLRGSGAGQAARATEPGKLDVPPIQEMSFFERTKLHVNGKLPEKSARFLHFAVYMYAQDRIPNELMNDVLPALNEMLQDHRIGTDLHDNLSEELRRTTDELQSVQHGSYSEMLQATDEEAARQAVIRALASRDEHLKAIDVLREKIAAALPDDTAICSAITLFRKKTAEFFEELQLRAGAAEKPDASPISKIFEDLREGLVSQDSARISSILSQLKDHGWSYMMNDLASINDDRLMETLKNVHFASQPVFLLVNSPLHYVYENAAQHARKKGERKDVPVVTLWKKYTDGGNDIFEIHVIDGGDGFSPKDYLNGARDAEYGNAAEAISKCIPQTMAKTEKRYGCGLSMEIYSLGQKFKIGTNEVASAGRNIKGVDAALKIVVPAARKTGSVSAADNSGGTVLNSAPESKGGSSKLLEQPGDGDVPAEWEERANEIRAKEQFDLGVKYTRNKQYEKAIQYFNDALKIDPALMPQAYLYMGWLNYALEKRTEAFNYWAMATSLDRSIYDDIPLKFRILVYEKEEELKKNNKAGAELIPKRSSGYWAERTFWAALITGTLWTIAFYVGVFVDMRYGANIWEEIRDRWLLFTIPFLEMISSAQERPDDSSQVRPVEEFRLASELDTDEVYESGLAKLVMDARQEAGLWQQWTDEYWDGVHRDAMAGYANGKVVAVYSFVRLSDKEIHADGVFVQKDMRGRGTGQALRETLLSRLKINKYESFVIGGEGSNGVLKTDEAQKFQMALEGQPGVTIYRDEDGLVTSVQIDLMKYGPLSRKKKIGTGADIPAVEKPTNAATGSEEKNRIVPNSADQYASRLLKGAIKAVWGRDEELGKPDDRGRMIIITPSVYRKIQPYFLPRSKFAKESGVTDDTLQLMESPEYIDLKAGVLIDAIFDRARIGDPGIENTLRRIVVVRSKANTDDYARGVAFPLAQRMAEEKDPKVIKAAHSLYNSAVSILEDLREFEGQNHLYRVSASPILNNLILIHALILEPLNLHKDLLRRIKMADQKYHAYFRNKGDGSNLLEQPGDGDVPAEWEERSEARRTKANAVPGKNGDGSVADPTPVPAPIPEVFPTEQAHNDQAGTGVGLNEGTGLGSQREPSPDTGITMGNFEERRKKVTAYMVENRDSMSSPSPDFARILTEYGVKVVSKKPDKHKLLEFADALAAEEPKPQERTAPKKEGTPAKTDTVINGKKVLEQIKKLRGEAGFAMSQKQYAEAVAKNAEIVAIAEEAVKQAEEPLLAAQLQNIINFHAAKAKRAKELLGEEKASLEAEEIAKENALRREREAKRSEVIALIDKADYCLKSLDFKDFSDIKNIRDIDEVASAIGAFKEFETKCGEDEELRGRFKNIESSIRSMEELYGEWRQEQDGSLAVVTRDPNELLKRIRSAKSRLSKGEALNPEEARENLNASFEAIKTSIMKALETSDVYTEGDEKTIDLLKQIQDELKKLPAEPASALPRTNKLQGPGAAHSSELPGDNRIQYGYGDSQPEAANDMIGPQNSAKDTLSFAEFIRKHFAGKTVVRGLDLDAGTGIKTNWVEELLKENFRDVIFKGIDREKQFVQIASKRGNTVELGLVENLLNDNAPASQDLITMFYPYPDSLRDFIAAAKKLVKRDGLIVITLQPDDMKAYSDGGTLYGDIKASEARDALSGFRQLRVRRETAGEGIDVFGEDAYIFIYGPSESLPASYFASKTTTEPYLEGVATRYIEDELAGYLPKGAKVLDLMSGAFTYVPDSVKASEIIGIGLNAEELKANKKLTRYLAQDLNKTAGFPAEWEGRFDAVVITSGMAYMKDPEKLLSLAAKALKNDGLVFIAFNPDYYNKEATQAWKKIKRREKAEFVIDSIKATRSFTGIEHKTKGYVDRFDLAENLDIIVARRMAPETAHSAAGSSARSRDEILEAQRIRNEAVSGVDAGALPAFWRSAGLELTIREKDEKQAWLMARISRRINIGTGRAAGTEIMSTAGTVYSEDRMQRLMDSPDYAIYSLSLRDTYGTYGLSGLAVLHKNEDPGVVDVELFCITCPSRDKTVERAFFNYLVPALRVRGVRQLQLDYKPIVEKEGESHRTVNSQTKDVLSDLGFKPVSDLPDGAQRYALDLEGYASKDTYISNVVMIGPPAILPVRPDTQAQERPNAAAIKNLLLRDIIYNSDNSFNDSIAIESDYDQRIPKVIEVLTTYTYSERIVPRADGLSRDMEQLLSSFRIQNELWHNCYGEADLQKSVADSVPKAIIDLIGRGNSVDDRIGIAVISHLYAERCYPVRGLFMSEALLKLTGAEDVKVKEKILMVAKRDFEPSQFFGAMSEAFDTLTRGDVDKDGAISDVENAGPATPTQVKTTLKSPESSEVTAELGLAIEDLRTRNYEKTKSPERMMLRSGNKIKTFTVRGSFHLTEDTTLNLVVDDESGELYVVRKLLTEDDEDHCAYVPDIMERLKGYEGVYQAQWMVKADDSKGWTGMDDSLNAAIVYPYIPGKDLAHILSEYAKLPLIEYSGKLLDIVIQVADICSYIEKKGVSGVWSIKPENIMVTPGGKPVLIDYTRKEVSQLPNIEFLLYDCIDGIDMKGIDGVLPALEFVSDPALNRQIVGRLTAIHRKMKANGYDNIGQFSEELKGVRALMGAGDGPGIINGDTSRSSTAEPDLSSKARRVKEEKPDAMVVNKPSFFEMAKQHTHGKLPEDSARFLHFAVYIYEQDRIPNELMFSGLAALDEMLQDHRIGKDLHDNLLAELRRTVKELQTAQSGSFSEILKATDEEAAAQAVISALASRDEHLKAIDALREKIAAALPGDTAIRSAIMLFRKRSAEFFEELKLRAGKKTEMPLDNTLADNIAAESSHAAMIKDLLGNRPYIKSNQLRSVSAPVLRMVGEYVESGRIDAENVKAVFVAGGVREEVESLVKRFPGRNFTVGNLYMAPLREISDSKELGDAGSLQLIRIDVSDLNPSRFPDKSYDLWFMEGIESAAYDISDATASEEEGMISRILAQALRVVRPGGYIFDGSSSLNEKFYPPLINDGYLERIAHNLYRRTAKSFGNNRDGSAANHKPVPAPIPEAPLTNAANNDRAGTVNIIAAWSKVADHDLKNRNSAHFELDEKFIFDDADYSAMLHKNLLENLLGMLPEPSRKAILSRIKSFKYGRYASKDPYGTFSNNEEGNVSVEGTEDPMLFLESAFHEIAHNFDPDIMKAVEWREGPEKFPHDFTDGLALYILYPEEFRAIAELGGFWKKLYGFYKDTIFAGKEISAEDLDYIGRIIANDRNEHAARREAKLSQLDEKERQMHATLSKNLGLDRPVPMNIPGDFWAHYIMCELKYMATKNTLDQRLLKKGRETIDRIGASNPRWKISDEKRKDCDKVFSEMEAKIESMPVLAPPIAATSMPVIVGPAMPTPEAEHIRAREFIDTVKIIRSVNPTQPIILALGTSFIKGYEREGRTPVDTQRYGDLNLLIKSIRHFCKENDITFVDSDDKDLLAAINEKREKAPNAKVIVLASRDSIAPEKETGSQPFLAPLRDDENVFLAAVQFDTAGVDKDCYMRIVDMLKLALELGLKDILRDSITSDNPNVNAAPLSDFRNVFIFLPKAERIKNYNDLHNIYEVQTFA